MSGNSFDHIAQELLKQKRVMDTLRAENRELHRQLKELRAGQGIFIEIAGQRFSLPVDAAVSHPVTTSVTAQLDFSSSLTPVMQQQEVEEIEFSDTHENVIAATPVAETPMVEVSPAPQTQQELEPTEITFLEEIMLDEFAAASTNHIATWTTGPTKKLDQEQIDEEQKAALRRDLMGSFLLE